MIMKKLVNIIICHLFYRVRYTHLENLTTQKRCVICPNHSHILDPFFLYPVSDNMYIMAKSELFKSKILSRIWKHYHVFPVNRNQKDPGSLLYSLELFENKRETQLLIFPEGGIVKQEQEIGKRVKKGPVFIASQAQVPIVPVYITRKPHLFSRVEIIFGKPYFIKKDIASQKNLVLEQSKLLIDQIYQLRKS